MCHYNHLTLVEREKIMYFRAQNYTILEIATLLQRNINVNIEMLKSSDVKM